MLTHSFKVSRVKNGVTEYVTGFSDDDKKVYWDADVTIAAEFDFVRYNTDWADTWVRFLKYNGDNPFTMWPQ